MIRSGGAPNKFLNLGPQLPCYATAFPHNFRCFSPFPLFQENYYFPHFCKFPPDFVKFTCFYILYAFYVSPSLNMMHFCITQCTYWTPMVIFLLVIIVTISYVGPTQRGGASDFSQRVLVTRCRRKNKCLIMAYLKLSI